MQIKMMIYYSHYEVNYTWIIAESKGFDRL